VQKLAKDWHNQLYGRLLLCSKRVSIRVLRIYAGSGNDELIPTLTHTTLDDSRPYDALSYTWEVGSQRPELITVKRHGISKYT